MKPEAARKQQDTAIELQPPSYTIFSALLHAEKTNEFTQEFDAKCYHIDAKCCHLIINSLLGEIFYFTSPQKGENITAGAENVNAEYCGRMQTILFFGR